MPIPVEIEEHAIVAMSTARSLSVRSSRIMARKRHGDELGPLTLGQAGADQPTIRETRFAKSALRASQSGQRFGFIDSM
jgi:hypothetical protein